MGKEIEFDIYYHGGPKDGKHEKIKASTIDAAAGKAPKSGPRYVLDQALTARFGGVQVKWVTE